MLYRMSRVRCLVALFGLFGGILCGVSEVHAASPLYIRPAGDDASCNGTVDVDYSVAVAPACAVKTVQKGIDDVDVGGEVIIRDGTFVEQLEIAKNLSLIGNGSATIIESPAVLTKSFMTSAANKPIVWVHNAADVFLDRFVVDGAGLGNANSRFVGVAYHNAGGRIEELEIKDISETPMSGAQHGVGIYAIVDDATARHIDVYGCAIYGYQKNGTAFSGADLSVEVADNDVTGAGPTDLIAQNGIQVSGGATGIVRDNTVQGNWCTHPTAGCTDDPTSSATADGSTGILLYASGDSVEIRNNVVRDNQYNIWTVASVDVDIVSNEISGEDSVGIAIWDSDRWTTALGYTEVGTSGEIRDNTITNMKYGMLNRDYTAGGALLTIEAYSNRFVGFTACPAWSDIVLDATNNWWGDNAPASHLDVCGNIDYDPWLEFKLSANPESLEVGTDVTLTASLEENSDGEEVSDVGSMTDGLEVTFGSDRGLISDDPIALSDGIAASVLTGLDEAGPVTVSATLDDQTVQLELSVTESTAPVDDGDGTGETTQDASGGGGCHLWADTARPRVKEVLVVVLFVCGLVVVRFWSSRDKRRRVAE